MPVKQSLDLRQFRTLEAHRRIEDAAVLATRCESVLGSVHSGQGCDLGDTVATVQPTTNECKNSADRRFVRRKRLASSSQSRDSRASNGGWSMRTQMAPCTRALAFVIMVGGGGL